MDHELWYEQQLVSEQLKNNFKIRSQQNMSAELQLYIPIFGSNRMKKRGIIQKELTQLCITYHLQVFRVCLHERYFKDIVN